MYIIEVSPIKHIKGFKTLSYFSTVKYKNGSILYVPLKSVKIPALVLNCKEIKEIKLDIKSAGFAPKKIPKQRAMEFFSDSFIDAVLSYSRDNIYPPGLVVESILPSKILKNLEKTQNKILSYKNDGEQKKKNAKIFIGKNYDVLAAIDFDGERVSIYKSLVREKLAQKESVIIIASNQKRARKIYEEISPGISKMVHLFDSSKTSRKVMEQYAFLSTSQEPLCIVGASKTISIDNPKIGLYIIDKEASPSYNKIKYPKVNIKNLSIKIAKNKNAQITLADNFLSLDTYKLLKEDEAQLIDNMGSKFRTNKKIQIINISEEVKFKKEFKKDFPYLSDKILIKLKKLIDSNHGSAFIFVPKRAYSTQVLCMDCSFVFKCPTCKANLKLHRKNEAAYMLCHRCGYSTRADVKCPVCSSWRLKEYGITSESLAQYIKKKLNYDAKTISSDTSPEDIKDALNDKKIIIGTHKALSEFQDLKFDISIVVAIDTLLSVPDFQIEEKIFYILSQILQMSKKEMIIQIRDENISSIKYFAKGELRKFAEQELRLRETLAWPPYSKIIKISIEGKRKEVIEKMQYLVNSLAKYQIRVFRDFEVLNKNEVRLSALLKIKNEIWEKDEKLKEFLFTLPSDFAVESNSSSTLD